AQRAQIRRGRKQDPLRGLASRRAAQRPAAELAASGGREAGARERSMTRINLRSIRQRLFLGITLTSAAALLITGAAIIVYDVRSYQQNWVNDLTTQAELLGRASAPALQFDDPKFARENLALLQVRPRIEQGAIYNAKGVLFARYVRADLANPSFPPLPEADGYRVESADLVLFRRIVENNEILGTVYLRAEYQLVD